MDDFAHRALVQGVDGTIVGADMRHLSWDDQYRLISNTVIPRPIALVSTDGPAGKNNFVIHKCHRRRHRVATG